MECFKCSLVLKPEEALRCVNCQKQFHYVCVGLGEVDYKKILPMNKAKWKCATCKITKKNVAAPLMIDSEGSTDIGIGSVTKVGTPTSKVSTSASAPLTSIMNIDSEKLFTYMDGKFNSLQESMRKQITDLQTSVEMLSNQYDSVKKSLDAQSKEMKILRNDNNSLKESMKILQSRVESLEEDGLKRDQWSRIQNVELVGIPEHDGESLPDVVMKLAAYIGTPLQLRDVEFAHRVQAKRPVKGKPRAIVVRLRERATKDALVNAARKSRGMTTKNLGLEGEPAKLHVNEHLTVANKNLLSKCRKRATEKGYTFVWTKNCRVYVRHSENMPYIQISKESDLEKIV